MASSVKQGPLSREGLDASAFDVVLWRAAYGASSRPAAEEGGEFAGNALALELVGITEERGTRVAALYDRTSDRLLLVRSGEWIRGRVVSRLTQNEVEIDGDGGPLTIALRRTKP